MPLRSGENKTTRGFRAGIWTSAGLHATALLAVVLGEPLGSWLFEPVGQTGASRITVVARADWDGAPRPDPVVEIEPPPLDVDSPQVGEAVADRIQRAIADSQQLSTDDQLERLEELSGRLNQVSSEESIDALANQFQKWLGTKPRASAPAAEAVSGEFDMSTAQIHDVRRESLDGGSFRYLAILVDAEGRQLETEMSEADGENLHRVMELIKRNPLLERVYRGIVMGLLDKMQNQAKPAK